MSGYLKTEKCVTCGETAVTWHGHVIARECMALGNYIEKKVIAGHCINHTNFMTKHPGGSYGKYNRDKMGKCIPFVVQ